MEEGGEDIQLSKSLRDLEALSPSDTYGVGVEERARKARLENDNTEQNITLRKKFSWAVFRLIVFFLVAVIVLLFLCALGWAYLSEAVLIAVVTTMTGTVIGLLILVIKYLFPHS